MSELEELPSWAGRAASQPLDQASAAESGPMPQHPRDEDRRRGPWMTALLVLFGLLALLAMGGIGYLLANSQDGTTEASADGSDETTVDDSQLNSEQVATGADQDSAVDDPAEADEDAGATDADGTDDGTDGATDEDVVTVEVDEDADADGAEAGADGTTGADGANGADGGGSDSGRQAIFRGGKVYLSGPVPSEEIGQVIEQKAAAVVGPDNVVNQYTIDPSAVIEPGDSAPIYVEDVILFEFNSVEIAPPFFPILDLGTLLLSQNPQASINVITRTDAVGSEAVNLEVSTARANAVIDYWLSKGVNPDQIEADPRGEELASDDDDEETAARNRRAEFIIIGLLD